MNLTPAVIVDIALIAVVVCTVLYYAHKGFVAGLISLVGNLVSLVLAWIVSGRVSPVVFENFFREAGSTDSKFLLPECRSVRDAARN